MNFFRSSVLALAIGLALTSPARAADWPTWGQAWSRNMVSAETGLPESFDPTTGRNVKWTAPLGTQTYASPVVAGGCVLIGTNNDRPRDPKHTGDRGVLLCLDEKDGGLRWQLIVSKLCEQYNDVYMDWPRDGICSPPTVEGERVYILTNRNEVMCLDIHGLANGNDGPFKDEARQLTPPGKPAEELTATDADIIWMYDMPKEINGFPHDGSHSSILIDGRWVYANTCNGRGKNHIGLRNPGGPSLIVLDKASGRLAGLDREAIEPFHCNWSSPALGEAGGRRLLFYGTSDPWLRAFEPLAQDAAAGTTHTLKLAWRAELDPTSPKDGNPHAWWKNRERGPGTMPGTPVFVDGRVYAVITGDIWWGKTMCWLTCTDAASGEVLWRYPMEKFGVTTPAVADGLVYAADCAGNIHCVDARTGQACWTHKGQGTDGQGLIWGSPLVADGKVYVGTRRGQFYILQAGREKKLLGEVALDAPCNSTVAAANGALYVATMKTLYAVKR